MGNKQVVQTIEEPIEFKENYGNLNEFLGTHPKQHKKIFINLKDQMWFNDRILQFTKALSKSVNLQTLKLDLKDNRIEKFGSKALGEALCCCKDLRVLDIDLLDNGISNSGAKQLFSSLKNCHKISYLSLNLRNNRIGEKGIISIGSALEKLKELSCLNLFFLNDKDQDCGGQAQLLLSLAKCKNLQRLELQLLGGFLNGMKTVIQIQLCHNFAKLQKLQTLSLSLVQRDENQMFDKKLIDEKGIYVLMNALNNLKSLSKLTLNLQNCKIQELKGFELGIGLSKCQNLQFLKLQLSEHLNQISGEQGVLNLIQGIKKCENLKQIELEFRQVIKLSSMKKVIISVAKMRRLVKKKIQQRYQNVNIFQ